MEKRRKNGIEQDNVAIIVDFMKPFGFNCCIHLSQIYFLPRTLVIQLKIYDNYITAAVGVCLNIKFYFESECIARISIVQPMNGITSRKLLLNG